MIRENNILSDQKLNLLKFIIKKIKIKYGNEHTEMKNGVPQGATTSPYLFNIVTKGLIDVIERN